MPQQPRREPGVSSKDEKGVKHLILGATQVKGDKNGTITNHDPNGLTKGRSAFSFKDQKGNDISRFDELGRDGELEVKYYKFPDGKGDKVKISGKDFANEKNNAGFDPNVRFERDENGLLLANEKNEKLLNKAVK